LGLKIKMFEINTKLTARKLNDELFMVKVKHDVYLILKCKSYNFKHVIVELYYSKNNISDNSISTINAKICTESIKFIQTFKGKEDYKCTVNFRMDDTISHIMIILSS